MTKLKEKCWTLVQHSAYVAKQDGTFQHQVERIRSQPRPSWGEL